MFPRWNVIPDWTLRKFIVNAYKSLVIRSDASRGGGGEGFPFPLILDQDQGSEVFLALSIWQKCPVWDTKTSIKFLAAQEVSKTLDYSRLYYRRKIKSPLIRSENFLNFIQNGLIKVRQKPKRLQAQRKHELSKVVLAFELADMSDNSMKTSLSKALKQEILNWDWQSLERIKPDTQGGQQGALKNLEVLRCISTVA